MLKKIMEPIRKVLKGGLLHILTGSFLTKAITMLSTVLIARLVSKEIYAYFSYTTNLYSYVELINGLELSGALLVFCSRSSDDDVNTSWLKYSLKVSVLVQFLISVLLCVVITFASIAYPQARKYFYLYLLIPIGTTIINCLQSFIRAYGQNKRFSVMGVVRAAVVTGVSIVLVPFLDVTGMIIAIYAGTIATIYIGAQYCLKIKRRSKTFEISKNEKKKFYVLALSFLVANAFSHLIPLNETFLVNELISDEVITANFKVAGLIPQQLAMIATGICIYFFPEIAKITDFNNAWKKIVKVGLCTGVATIIIGIIGMVTSPLIIRILYGEKYMDAISMSYILWIMRTVDCTLRIVPITFLPALGDTRFNYVASPIFCIIHVLLDYFMISNYGIQGIAFATIISYTLWAICAWCYLRKYCKEQRYRVQE